MKWAKQQGYIDVNPITEIEVPAAEQKQTVISEAKFHGLLTYIRNEALRDLVIVTWETGCRPQEQGQRALLRALRGIGKVAPGT